MLSIDKCCLSTLQGVLVGVHGNAGCNHACIVTLSGSCVIGHKTHCYFDATNVSQSINKLTKHIAVSLLIPYPVYNFNSVQQKPYRIQNVMQIGVQTTG